VEALTYGNDAIEAVVLPDAGARLHRLRAFGHDLLRTPDDPGRHLSEPFFWGGYVMAPWCNRIEPRPEIVASHRVDLVPNFPDGSAIHGQVFVRPWKVLDDGSCAVLGGGEGWPWPYQVDQRVAISGTELRIELDLTNLGADPMPAGLGLHPWFRRSLLLAIGASRVFTDNTMSEPEPRQVATPFDLRVMGEVASDLDATWADLADPAVELFWTEVGVRATMRIEAPQSLVVVASPGGLDAIAVEPQTHGPNGLRRLLNGETAAMTLLSPDDTLSLVTRIEFEQLD
jgi:aldose 1-epimerase